MTEYKTPHTQAARMSPDSRSAAGGTPSEGLTVVGIGASAGGLEACKKLLQALPGGKGMAFILVQHLEPTHKSMMVDLLASHTSMIVQQAVDGVRLEHERLYIIPPGAYLSVSQGVLRLSRPQAPHGARLPFDFLLHSLAKAYGLRAVCIVLSGTGADGSLGLQAVKARDGLVIVQDPDEAGQDGMPRSAIMTGAVDVVLRVANIPEALENFNRMRSSAPMTQDRRSADHAQDPLPRIIDLLRRRTTHDFTLYKRGTLQRRIERRMALVGIDADRMDRYLDTLRNDADAISLLANDFLINVTSFFRDPAVFALLAEKIIPDLLGSRTPEHPLRIWIAGCSTGEETYSLAMLFREQITAMKSAVKLQVFASDVDPDAVATAREGLYPKTIETDVSAERLARFFLQEDENYRISPELRATVVFTTQDILADPPFSRLDMVSCRNLLIYLGTEAQMKVMSIFHFALRGGGILLLGGSETVASQDDRFEAISEPYRIYRHFKQSQPGYSMSPGSGAPSFIRLGNTPAPRRQVALADLCRKLVMDTYAPAAVLVNRKHECLYSSGPIDRYLRVVSGHATHSLLDMAPQGLRAKLRSALRQADQENTRITVPGGRVKHGNYSRSFSLDIQSASRGTETLLLVCFVDDRDQEQGTGGAGRSGDVPSVSALELELEATRTDLEGAIRDLELSAEEQKTINEEALSVNEEYQSTNEELLTSKEEMQSLNEELTALNNQLQETLERQRTTSNDLQNILYSTDVATLFLDTDLNIRFFTPATRSLFSLIPGDVGRPLADLNAISGGVALSNDAQVVLQTSEPVEREIETQGGAWFSRRILPYRTHDNGVDGVVITFIDITERKRASQALEVAKQLAESASVAKSRFLAAASHDLRQPLQTLTLLHGLLAKTAQTDPSQNLLGRLDQAVSAMSGMLNALLDINQIEAGIVRAEMIDFKVADLLAQLRDEFDYHAKARGLVLHVVSSGLCIRSDPRLLEQMIRNLLSNALKYTRHGRVLLGCRRHQGSLSIEVWDTGIGIPEDEVKAIFEEYRQLDNAARERSKGLGLGLSIVQRLGALLDHRIRVRSRPGNGSVFAIDVALARDHATLQAADPGRSGQLDAKLLKARRLGAILVVEDDPAIGELLDIYLKDEGYHVRTAHDGVEAQALVEGGIIHPDLILTDFNLPNGLNGLQLAGKLRESLHRAIPTIILTGDISADTLRDIALQDCTQLAKPVKLNELAQFIQRLLATPVAGPEEPASPPAKSSERFAASAVFVIDDDHQLRETLRATLERNGQLVETYPTSEAFLEAYRPGRNACLLIDAYLPGMSGLELLRRLRGSGDPLPTIVITGNSDVQMAVQAMKAGASDFIEKPIGPAELLASIERALALSRDTFEISEWRKAAAAHIADLTPRQRQIMEAVLAGHPSKNIALDLDISQRTVENHRASIMKKTGTKSIPALARLALAAGWNTSPRPPLQETLPAGNGNAGKRSLAR